MINESPALDLINSSGSITSENQAESLVTNTELLNVFRQGFRSLHKMQGNLDGEFRSDFPKDTAPWNQGIGRRLFRTLSRKPLEPIDSDPITGIKQLSDADCVGAGFMSVFNAVTGIPITTELYNDFLQTAKNSGFGEDIGSGVKVLPFVFNLFSSPEFKASFPSLDVTVAFRRGLSVSDLSEVVAATREKKDPSYKLFTFLPFASWTQKDGGHIVTLIEINQSEVVVFDPRVGQKKTLHMDYFNDQWIYDENSAIFVFSADKSKPD